MDGWHVLSALIAAFGAGLIAMAVLRLPRSPIAPAVYAFVAAGIAWIVGDLVAEAATGMGWKRAGLLLLYSGSISAPALWWAIAIRWAHDSGADLPLRSKAWERVPFAFAGLMWLVMITNPLHGAFLTPVIGGRNVYEPLWYVMAIPGYSLILAALAVELAVVIRVPRRDVRRQGGLLIAASLVTLLGNQAYVTGVTTFNLTPAVLAASGALLVLGMARQGLFGVMPTALRAIADDHPDGLVVVDPKGLVRFANARADELLAPLEIDPSESFLDTLRDPRLRGGSSRLLRGEAGEPWATLGRPAGVLFRLQAGQGRWLLFRAHEVVGDSGRTKGHGVRISDLTAHREGETRALQARRLESTADLARAVSRQFQSSFALVQSNAELLLAESPERPASERKLARIIEAANAGSELALQLQLYAGTVGTTRVVLELSEVVQESCDLIQGDVPSHCRVAFDACQELLPVEVDALQLRHAIFEVLMNAVEATARRGGEIRVSTGSHRIDPATLQLVWGEDQPAGEYAYVRVRDLGGGMDAETEERAFEPFFSTRGKDRGDGLPLVLGIARAHGAPIALDNEADRGCEVTLYFPRDPDPEPTRSA